MSDGANEKLAATRWVFAEQDPQALEEIRARLIKTAKSKGSQELIPYSDLVAGILFRIPTVNGGRGFEIDTHSWSEFDRGLIGDFLGCVAAESYREHGFLLSALAVSKIDKRPSESFFTWARSLGLLRDSSEDARLQFWFDQIGRIRNHYAGKGTAS